MRYGEKATTIMGLIGEHRAKFQLTYGRDPNAVLIGSYVLGALMKELEPQPSPPHIEELKKKYNIPPAEKPDGVPTHIMNMEIIKTEDSNYVGVASV